MKFLSRSGGSALILMLCCAVLPTLAAAENRSLLSSSFEGGSSSWSPGAPSCTGIGIEQCGGRYRSEYTAAGGFNGLSSGFLRSSGKTAGEGMVYGQVGWNSPIFTIPADRNIDSVSGRFFLRSHVIEQPLGLSLDFATNAPESTTGAKVFLKDLSSGVQREVFARTLVPANFGSGRWDQVDFSIPAEFLLSGGSYQIVVNGIFAWNRNTINGLTFTVAEDIDNFELNADLKEKALIVPPVDPQPPVVPPKAPTLSTPSELSDGNCRMISVAGGKRSTRVAGRKVRVLVQGGQPATPARTFNVTVQTSGARLPASFFLDGKKLALKRGVLQIKPSILGSRDTANLKVRVGSGKQAKSLTIKLRFRPCVRVFWIAKRQKNLRARVVSRVPIQSVTMFLPAQMRLRSGNAGTAVGALKLGTQRVPVTRAQGFAQNGGLLAPNTATIKYNKAQNTVSIENFSALPQTLELELLGKALTVTNSRERLRATAVVQDQEGKTKLLPCAANSLRALRRAS